MTAQSDAAVASVAPVVSLTVESALQENRILAWYRGESRQEIERILYIDLAADRLYVIALNDDHVWPKPRTCSEVEAALAVADAVVIPEAEALGIAAYSRLHMPDDEYYALIAERAGNRQRSTDERERTQRAWSAVEIITELPDADAFIPIRRGPKVREAMKMFGFTRPTMHTYLRRFWQSGQIPTALRPHYDCSGGKGQRRFAADPVAGNKRGRKSDEMLRLGQDDGINVTETYEHKIRRGIALFHRDGASLTDAWKTTKERFFAPGVRTQIGLMGESIGVALAPGRNQAPSLPQFRTVYYRDLKRPKALEEEIKKQEGKRAFNTRRRARTGNSTIGTLQPIRKVVVMVN